MSKVKKTVQSYGYYSLLFNYAVFDNDMCANVAGLTLRPAILAFQYYLDRQTEIHM